MDLVRRLLIRPFKVGWICIHDEAFWRGFGGLLVVLFFILIHHLEWLQIFDETFPLWGAAGVFAVWATITVIWNCLFLWRGRFYRARLGAKVGGYRKLAKHAIYFDGRESMAVLEKGEYPEGTILGILEWGKRIRALGEADECEELFCEW